jgi:hypothetical protein
MTRSWENTPGKQIFCPNKFHQAIMIISMKTGNHSLHESHLDLHLGYLHVRFRMTGISVQRIEYDSNSCILDFHHAREPHVSNKGLSDIFSPPWVCQRLSESITSIVRDVDDECATVR